jgi:putative tryptophan/tyrosine transport system substrate-binding protein
MNLQIHILRASTDHEIDEVFENIAAQRIQALAVAADPFFDTRREKLVALAAYYAVPTMYHFREFAVAGGLVSYGIDASDAYRLVGVYTGRVPKGAKPAELPVMQSIKFQFVINLKTAKALGLEIPPGLSAIADEVIERTFRNASIDSGECRYGSEAATQSDVGRVRFTTESCRGSW